MTMPTIIEATKQASMNAETSAPNFAWSIPSRGINLTLIDPSKAKQLPSPNTHNNATS